MGAEEEAGHDAEISAAAAQRPQEVGVLRLGSGDETAVGQNQVRFEQIIRREPVLAAEVTVTAAQREPGDAGGRDDPEWHGLTEGLGRVIDVAGRAARAHSHRLVLGVDPHALHRRQVDDQAVVDAAETRAIVAAAANGDRELVVPAEIDRGDHVGDVGASGDEQRPLVDHGVVELSRLFVFRMVAPDNRPAKTLGKFGNDFVVHRVTSSLMLATTESEQLFAKGRPIKFNFKPPSIATTLDDVEGSGGTGQPRVGLTNRGSIVMTKPQPRLVTVGQRR